ncbi:MAG: tetratricopeptide repeat protein [Timaviella obliquedivisa GSE-PSE-MK23-08B]|jgi:tetratricopeptide (TPR) repeat protein|nr:tetratricopeptide repeat protein [Timaviella obliquedivisa GSE-PSE-MK23-08B]
MNAGQKRDRGRLLTPEALRKLQQAIRVWEVRHEKKCTQERIKELTGEFKEGGLDPGTISKILKGKEGVDSESIRCLFQSFRLQLKETDLVAAIAFLAQGDPNFVGREGAIADLQTLTNQGTKVIVIQARGGVGKTTLARKYLQQEFGTFLEFPIAKETKDIASVESLIEEKLRQLGEEPGREFLVSIDRLKRKLQSERIGILIDNLEPALDSAGKLIEAHRRYVELLRVLADPMVRSLTLITTRERLREPSITVQPYLLRSLDVAAWETYFQSRNIATEGSALSALHNAYGGNAKAMDILSGAIAEDFSGDISVYWLVNQDDLLIERDLEDLVTTQFNRMQELDGKAYNLLCRMGCYRYQDVPRVPIEGLLCLLWDVVEGQRRRVIKALQDRSLVDCEGGEYWLHPVIRGEAIGRLRTSEDLETTNRKASKVWVESVKTIETIEDALRAFEAYYHCVEIKDFELASNIILAKRDNKWLSSSEFGMDLTCSLASSFSRLGLLQQIISSCSYLVDRINNEHSVNRLYAALGDAYWMVGNALKALESHEKSRKIASLHNHKELEIVALLDLGLCKEDLWEVEEAIGLYKDVILLSENTDYKRHAAQARYCLARLYSYLDSLEEAKFYIDQVWQDFPKIRLGIRSTGYRLYTLGFVSYYLGDTEKSLEMYGRAIEYAEQGKFVQLKAISLIGLAILYREQGKVSNSLSIHAEAIELLRSVGAKHNCAEAYYQLGLTYKAMDRNEMVDENLQKSIQLFIEIEAPKQAERVSRSLVAQKKEKP